MEPRPRILRSVCHCEMEGVREASIVRPFVHDLLETPDEEYGLQNTFHRVRRIDLVIAAGPVRQRLESHVVELGRGYLTEEPIHPEEEEYRSWQDGVGVTDLSMHIEYLEG